MKFATLLFLTAGAVNAVEIDLFNIKNFMKLELMPQLLKSTARTTE